MSHKLLLYGYRVFLEKVDDDLLITIQRYQYHPFDRFPSPMTMNHYLISLANEISRFGGYLLEKLSGNVRVRISSAICDYQDWLAEHDPDCLADYVGVFLDRLEKNWKESKIPWKPFQRVKLDVEEPDKVDGVSSTALKEILYHSPDIIKNEDLDRIDGLFYQEWEIFQEPVVFVNIENELLFTHWKSCNNIWGSPAISLPEDRYHNYLQIYKRYLEEYSIDKFPAAVLSERFVIPQEYRKKYLFWRILTEIAYGCEGFKKICQDDGIENHEIIVKYLSGAFSESRRETLYFPVFDNLFAYYCGLLS